MRTDTFGWMCGLPNLSSHDNISQSWKTADCWQRSNKTKKSHRPARRHWTQKWKTVYLKCNMIRQKRFGQESKRQLVQISKNHFQMQKGKSEIGRYLLRRWEKSVCRASKCISAADYYKSETCKSRFLLKVTAEHLISDFKKIKGSLWRLGFVIKIDIMTRAKRACHSIGHYTNWWA